MLFLFKSIAFIFQDNRFGMLNNGFCNVLRTR